MRWQLLTLPVCIASLASACGTAGGERRPGDPFSSPLAASPRNAGEIANASFAAQGDQTSVRLTVGGVPSGSVRPVRLYTYIYAGRCGQLAASPAYELNDSVTPNSTDQNRATPPFSLNKTVPLPLDKLRTGGYAVVIRSSPADGNVDLFCGEIG